MARPVSVHPFAWLSARGLHLESEGRRMTESTPAWLKERAGLPSRGKGAPSACSYVSPGGQAPPTSSAAARTGRAGGQGKLGNGACGLPQRLPAA